MLARTPDSRRSARRWTRRAVEVIFGERGRPVQAVLHNISDGGACIGFEKKLGKLPRKFMLVLSKDSVQRLCQVMWSNDSLVGVKFASPWLGVGKSGISIPQRKNEMSAASSSRVRHGQ